MLQCVAVKAEADRRGLRFLARLTLYFWDFIVMANRRGRRSGRRSLGVAACLLFAACGAVCQTAVTAPSPQSTTGSAGSTSDPQASAVGAQPPAWDAATIKPSKADARGSMIQFTPDGIRISNVPLQMILRESFGVEDEQISGWPSWTKTTMLDVEAKVAPEDAPKLKAMKIDQRKQMLVQLFEDRCNLKFHHETRELSVYQLVVGKDGVKMVSIEARPTTTTGARSGCGARARTGTRT